MIICQHTHQWNNYIHLRLQLLKRFMDTVFRNHVSSERKRSSK